MKRFFTGTLLTIGYTYFEYLTITLFDSLVLQLIPIFIFGIAMSYLWHIGFLAGLSRDALGKDGEQ